MNLIKTKEEIEKMRAGGRILATALHEVAAAVQPGITTSELNDIAEQALKKAGARPSFLGYGRGKGNSYPASLCTSINEAVVHAIPSPDIKLEAGQIIGLDLGCWYEGLCTDMAITVPVGEISVSAQKLIKITEQSLYEGLKQIKSGARLGDIGQAIQALVEANGFSVVRDLCGHGVGHAVHEDPAIPNFGRAGTGLKLEAGMTIAIEPMVNMGKARVDFLADGWTVVTSDKSLSAHFEHTVVVTEQGCEILTQ